MSLAIATPAAHAETVREMYVAAGNYSFLEKEYNDPKYAGVKTVVPGLASGVDAADPTPVQALRVTYDADQIDHEALMRVFWQHSDPTNAAGQFKEIGPQYRAAVWVSGAAERAEVERNAARLESSGIFGKGKSIVLPILDAPPASFEDAPKTPVASSSPTPSSWRRKPRFDLRRSKTCGGSCSSARTRCAATFGSRRSAPTTASTSSRSTAPETQACPSSPATTSRSPEDPSEEKTRGREDEGERGPRVVLFFR